MPIFEYRCTKCGQVFEHLTMRKNADDPPACKKCGAKEVERVLSAFTGRAAAGGCGSAASGGG